MTLEEKLAALPDSPGVYLMKNVDGKIIYVGKAISLKRRVRSYFRTLPHDAQKTKALVQNIADLEYILTDSEIEALVLECNLIKKYRPKYNISLTDDKTYPYLKITNEEYPRVIVSRQYIKDGGKYYGPYPSVTVLRETLELLRQIFPFRTCNQRTFHNERPCLNYQIKRCYAPCTNKITKAEYRQMIDKIADFFDGNHEELLKTLTQQMYDAAEKQNFEQAARLRDQIKGIERAISEQKAVLSSDQDQDVLAIYRSGEDIAMQVFFVRKGKVIGRENYFLQNIQEADAEIYRVFLQQFYYDNQFIPPLILVGDTVNDSDLIEQWLTQKRGSKVQLRHPKRGTQKELIELVARNAKEALEKKIGEEDLRKRQIEEALLQLKEALGLSRLPKRIECYDISNTQGTESVASMVVFVDGKAKRNQYRHFKIKTVEGANDFESMNEVLRRRLKYIGEKNKDFAEEAPDLIIVDGGKGQLSSAVAALEQQACADIPIAGLAKKEELLFLPNRSEPIYLPRDSQGLFLVQRIRDEAHRFAITFHRSLRGKRNLASILDDIPGVGKKRKEELLRHFGSLSKIEQASAEELAQVEGIGVAMAEEIYEYLKNHQDLQSRLKHGREKI